MDLARLGRVTGRRYAGVAVAGYCDTSHDAEAVVGGRISSEEHRVLLAIVEQALDVNPDDRERWLAVHCAESLREKALRMCEAAANVTGDIGLEFGVMEDAGQANAVGKRVGPYRLTELLGEGGKGQVFRAERVDGGVEGQVALKIFRTPVVSAQAKARFEAEVELLAGLKHPNLVRIIDYGTNEEGMPYLVTELVQGLPLDADIRVHGLDIYHRLARLVPVCAALETAHRALVVHRDIKPGNILVTTGSDTKLLNVGVPRAVALSQGDDSQTITKLATPAYASPEQLSGKRMTAASDVYSVGVVLYECLTGERPFEPAGASIDRFAQAVTEAPLELPSARLRRRGKPEARRVAGDLDAIVQRALAKAPDDRYVSVGALGEDLRRYIHGKPATVREHGFAYRLFKFLRRHKDIVITGAVVASLLFALFALTVRRYQSSDAERLVAAARFEKTWAYSSQTIAHLGTPADALPRANAAEHLLDTLADTQPSPSLTVQLAEGYLHLAEALSDPKSVDGHHPSRAEATLVKAEALLEPLHQKEPSSPEVVGLLIRVRDHLSRLQLAGSTPPSEAVEQALAGVQLAESEVAKKLQANGFRAQHKWNLREGLVSALVADGRAQDALGLLEGYLPELESPGLPETLEDYDQKRTRLAFLRAELHAAQGSMARAVADYQTAFDGFTQLARAHPRDRNHRVARAKSCLAMVEGLQALEQWREAIKTSRRCLRIRRLPRRMKAQLQVYLARGAVGLGSETEARLHILRAADLYARLGLDSPEDAEMRLEHAEALIEAADILGAAGASMPRACRWVEAAETLLDNVRQMWGGSPYQLSRVENRCGESLARWCKPAP